MKAEEAKKIASEYTDDDYDTIIGAIKVEALLGNRRLFRYSQVSFTTLRILKSDGYIVSHGTDRDEYLCTITW